ncbi:Uncharacterised protein [Vibrio cholerae]|uniref:Uncharacterized protein n=1 Tax=Vibrio cholerae TaxID=666 RepID=A0A655XA45_VIBCL|nr:Uncharacterised protein [Vibrio cholerae]CSC09574.1 Uncharacterised protein [Vibrio cholerae]
MPVLLPALLPKIAQAGWVSRANSSEKQSISVRMSQIVINHLPVIVTQSDPRRAQ